MGEDLNHLHGLNEPTRREIGGTCPGIKGKLAGRRLFTTRVSTESRGGEYLTPGWGLEMGIGTIIAARGAPLSLSPTDTVGAAAGLMAERRIGFLLILEASGALAGVISERDIVREVAAGSNGLSDRPALDIATKAVTTCGPNDDPHDIFALMNERKFRHMPVEEGGKIIGVVSMSDLLRQFEAESAPDAKAKAFQAFLSGEMVPGG